MQAFVLIQAGIGLTFLQLQMVGQIEELHSLRLLGS